MKRLLKRLEKLEAAVAGHKDGPWTWPLKRRKSRRARWKQ